MTCYAGLDASPETSQVACVEESVEQLLDSLSRFAQHTPLKLATGKCLEGVQVHIAYGCMTDYGCI